MPEVSIDIGGKSFTVSCQSGEEQYLVSAAASLNAEADKLGDQNSKISESRMLLMAGLMLADKTADMNDKLTQAEASLSEATAEIKRLKSRSLDQSEPVEVIPEGLAKNLAEITLKAESLADQLNS